MKGTQSRIRTRRATAQESLCCWEHDGIGIPRMFQFLGSGSGPEAKRYGDKNFTTKLFSGTSRGVLETILSRGKNPNGTVISRQKKSETKLLPPVHCCHSKINVRALLELSSDSKSK
jgi:hypothetical protein